MEELKKLVREIGFKISVRYSFSISYRSLKSDIKNEQTIDTTYTNNAKSMLGYIYHASFWTATKI